MHQIPIEKLNNGIVATLGYRVVRITIISFADMMNRIFVLMMVLVATSCLDSKDNKLQRFLIQGNDAATRKSFGEAKRYYTEALKLDSCFVDAWNNLGTVYYKEAHYAEELDAYTSALQCDPQMQQALVNRSNTFYELNRNREALDDINAFARLSPDTTITHLSRGLIFTKMLRYDDAIESFERVLDREPRHTDALVNLGTVYYYKKNYDSARVFLDMAIESAPQEANAYNAYALLEHDLGNNNEALRRVNQALSIKEDDPYFRNNRGYIRISMDELDKALSDIDKSIGEDPYNAWAYRNKGVYFLRTKQTDAAIRLLTKAEQMDTTVSKLYYFLSEANFQKGDKLSGCRYLKKSLQAGEVTQGEYLSKCK